MTDSNLNEVIIPTPVQEVNLNEVVDIRNEIRKNIPKDRDKNK